MKCALAVFLAFCCLAWSWGLEQSEGLSLDLSAPPQTLSQRLNDLATRLEQAQIGLNNDLEILLTEREWLYGELKLIQTSAVESEKEMQSIRESLKSFKLSLSSSIRRERLWKGLALGSGGLVLGLGAVLVVLQLMP
jgi:hypothetical protein